MEGPKTNLTLEEFQKAKDLLDSIDVRHRKQQALLEAEASGGSPHMNRKARRRLAALKRKAKT